MNCTGWRSWNLSFSTITASARENLSASVALKIVDVDGVKVNNLDASAWCALRLSADCRNKWTQTHALLPCRVVPKVQRVCQGQQFTQHENDPVVIYLELQCSVSSKNIMTIEVCLSTATASTRDSHSWQGIFTLYVGLPVMPMSIIIRETSHQSQVLPHDLPQTDIILQDLCRIRPQAVS